MPLNRRLKAAGGEAIPASGDQTLPLRELEAFSRSRLPVFLAFLHARIAREKPFLPHKSAQLGAELDQGACDAVLHCAGLPVHAAAFNSNMNIEFVEVV